MTLTTNIKRLACERGSLLRHPIVSLLALLVLPNWALAQPFEAGCDLPFANIAQGRVIDDECGIEGETSSTKYKLQNRAKNNFCAGIGEVRHLLLVPKAPGGH